MRKLITLLGLLFMYAYSVLWAWVFIFAYVTPTKTATIYFNLLNEASVELFLFMAVVTVATLSLHHILQLLNNGKPPTT